jgi:hypothetical protein
MAAAGPRVMAPMLAPLGTLPTLPAASALHAPKRPGGREREGVCVFVCVCVSESVCVRQRSARSMRRDEMYRRDNVYFIRTQLD